MNDSFAELQDDVPVQSASITENVGGQPKTLDLTSSFLNTNRSIFLNSTINDDMALSIAQQLMKLDSIGKGKPITLYINSPGGVVTSGMMIYDIMQTIKSPVRTVCMGQACSMGSFLLMAGEPGHRYITPEARIMVHQPSGGAYGMASDIEISNKEIQRIKKRMAKLYAKHCGGTESDWKTMKDRDFFVGGRQAKKLGLVDKIGLPSLETFALPQPANQNKPKPDKSPSPAAD